MIDVVAIQISFHLILVVLVEVEVVEIIHVQLPCLHRHGDIHLRILQRDHRIAREEEEVVVDHIILVRM